MTRLAYLWEFASVALHVLAAVASVVAFLAYTTP